MGFVVKEILGIGENILSESNDPDFKNDARILLGHLLGYDDQKLFRNWTSEVDDDCTESYFEAIRRRADGEPTQYITGKQYFMGRDFKVGSGVLIPRDDTETLVRAVFEYIKSCKSMPKTVLDLGTGSGIIALSIAAKYRSIKLTASDVSTEALAIAMQNAKSFSLEKNVDFVKSDMFENFKTGFGGKKFDIIASNPPYIKRSVLPTLQREIYEHEPMIALDGGDDGLDFYRAIAEKAHVYLKKDGALFLEIGYDQASEVSEILDSAGVYKSPEVLQDIAGLDRLVMTRLK